MVDHTEPFRLSVKEIKTLSLSQNSEKSSFSATTAESAILILVGVSNFFKFCADDFSVPQEHYTAHTIVITANSFNFLCIIFPP